MSRGKHGSLHEELDFVVVTWAAESRIRRKASVAAARCWASFDAGVGHAVTASAAMSVASAGPACTEQPRTDVTQRTAGIPKNVRERMGAFLLQPMGRRQPSVQSRGRLRGPYAAPRQPREWRRIPSCRRYLCSPAVLNLACSGLRVPHAPETTSRVPCNKSRAATAESAPPSSPHWLSVIARFVCLRIHARHVRDPFVLQLLTTSRRARGVINRDFSQIGRCAIPMSMAYLARRHDLKTGFLAPMNLPAALETSACTGLLTPRRGGVTRA